jgi:hypothetical protein
MSDAPWKPSTLIMQPLPRGGFWLHVVRWTPVIVPVVYIVVVFAVQPDDHMGPPDWAPDLRNVLYDDVDVTVMAQRGLSAQLGQVPGLPDWNERPQDEFARGLDEDRPLEKRYFLEYPHTALLIFRLGWWLQPAPPPVPAVVVDSCQSNVLRHRPRNEQEREVWRAFRWATHIYFVLMLGCYFGLVAVLRSGYQPGSDLMSMCTVLVLPSAIYFTMNRFDIVPALLNALSFWCLGRRRIAASAVLLALAAAVKVYPVLLAPLVVRYLWSERRSAIAWALVFGATLAGLQLWPLWQYGLEGLLAPYRHQFSRVWIMPMTIYDSLLPVALGGDTAVARGFRLGSVVLTVGVLSLLRVPDLASLLRRSAVVLIVFQCLQVFYSPQFYIWLVPLLLPLASRHRGLIWLVALLDVLTFVTFPAGAPTRWMYDLALPARYLLCGLLIVLLLAWDVMARRRREHTAPASALASAVCSGAVT